MKIHPITNDRLKEFKALLKEALDKINIGQSSFQLYDYYWSIEYNYNYTKSNLAITDIETNITYYLKTFDNVDVIKLYKIFS